MKDFEKKIKRDIEKYLDSLKHFIKKYPKGNKIKLGSPNDKHLRTYIKNWYHIKLLFPKTLELTLSLNRKESKKLISGYKRNKELMIKKISKKLNNKKPFVIK